MKRLFDKILGCVLSATTAFSCVACGTSSSTIVAEGLSTWKNPNPLTEINYVWKNENEKERVSLSNTYLYADGRTDYAIVISREKDSTVAERYAAEELQFFLKDATGITFPIVYDTNISGLDKNAKYISVGYTSIYKDSPMFGTLSEYVLGNDGFKIQTYGNTVVINAHGNNGILYGVYGFLERNMDYRYYFQDEWAICRDPQRKLMNMDVCDIPTFESRYLNRDSWDERENLESNVTYMLRLRHHGSLGQTFDNGTEGGGWWGTDQSLCQQLLRVEDYANEHPSWYYAGGSAKYGQLCFSTILANEEDNGLRPLDELFNNLVKYITDNPGLRIFLLGINDNEYFCHPTQGTEEECNCTEQIEQIRYSGQMCILANILSERLEAWQKALPEDDPNKTRNIMLAFFGYKGMIEAPTVYDEETNTYTIIEYDYDGDGDNDLKLRDNVYVRVTPIRSQYTRTNFDTEYNSAAYQSFMAWSSITDHLAVWDYATCFYDYLTPYPDWGVLQDNLLFYRYLGVTEMFTQLPTGSSGTSFFALNLYLRAQLMWDVNQNVQALTEDFFMHYYGPQAYEKMYSYYNYIRSYYQMMDYKYGYDLGYTDFDGVRLEYRGGIYDITSSQTYFPYKLVMRLEDFFFEAENALEAVKATESKYEQYLDRVHGESLFYRYLLLKNYQTNYSEQERAEMIDLFEEYAKVIEFMNFKSGAGVSHTQVADQIAVWRKALNG